MALKDFADLVTAVRTELKIPATDTNAVNKIKLDINAIYLDEVMPHKRWLWATRSTKVVHKSYYGIGTVSVTPGSATATLSVAPAASFGSFAGYKFSTEAFSEVYTISAHTAQSTTVTLSSEYQGILATTATFKIWKDTVVLPSGAREVIEVTNSSMREPMVGQGFKEFRQTVAGQPKAVNYPVFYNVAEYTDPTPLTDELEADRYRTMRIHPAITSQPVTLDIDYITEVDWLTDDGDEPILPIEDRIVLVYGALSRAWARERNEERAVANDALYQRKLGRMAGKIEEGFDRPRITISSKWARAKRGPRAKGFGTRTGEGSESFGSGGGYQIPTYLAGTTINGANLTGNLTAANGITVDGRDVSVDGATLDALVISADATQDDLDAVEATIAGIAAHIVDTTDAHAASAITNTPLGNLAATTVQGALNELQGDINTINTSVGAASGIASLDSGGKIPSSQIPALALIDVSAVANIAARDALTVQEGDVAVVADAGSGVSKSYIYNGAGWTELLADGSLAAHQASSSAHAAASITNSPSGNLAATTVQGALNELQTQLDLAATNPMTTGGDIIYGGASGTPTRLANGSANQYLKSAGGTSAPTWATFTPPTITQFLAGSSTYSAPAGCKWLRVRMLGAGGGGGGSGTAGGGTGGAGGNTTFGTHTANGGTGGIQIAGNAGTGGSGTIGAGGSGFVIQGGRGCSGSYTNNSGGTNHSYPLGGAGGISFFGGAGQPILAAAGSSASDYTGSGGAGGSSNNIAVIGGGSGGGAGGYVEVIIPNPSGSYSYGVATSTVGGTAGTSGAAGGGGAGGQILIEEHYQ